MSKHTTREDKSCQNCGSFVEKRYCPNCGQENKDSRESFHHLFIEFVADFVHYDSSFWKTTRYLLFSPAKLSLEYMDGKRKSYVNPVKLYIFISFIAFFIPSILPVSENKKSEERLINFSLDHNNYEDIEGYGRVTSLAQLDSIHFSKPEDQRIKEKKYDKYKSNFIKWERFDSLLQTTDNKDSLNIIKARILGQEAREIEGYGLVRNTEHLDSIHSSMPEEKRISFIQYQFEKSTFQLQKNLQTKEKQHMAVEFMAHNISKVLFIYMPIFAFWMWLFNINRRKYYFDSGIFTLHFFSFILLIITIFNILSCIFIDWVQFNEDIVYFLLIAVLSGYSIFYFFRANRIYYREKRWLANTKGIFLFIINNILILAILLSFVFFAFTRKYG